MLGDVAAEDCTGTIRASAVDPAAAALAKSTTCVADQPDRDARLRRQRLELVEVADPAQLDHGDVQHGVRSGPRDVLQVQRVLRRQADVQPGDNAEDRQPRTLLEEAHPFREQRAITPEAVHHQPSD